MFNRIYDWAIARGARVLFAIALLTFLVGLVQTLTSVAVYSAPEYPNMGPNAALLALSTGLMSTLSQAAVPLAGSLLVESFGRWRSSPAASGD